MANSQVHQASPNRNIMLIGVLLFILGVGVSLEFLAPNLRATQASLETEKSKLKGVETDIKVLTTAQNQLQQAEDIMKSERGVDFTRVPLIYPKTEDVPGMYLQLESIMAIAQVHGVNQPVYQVSPPTLDPVENSVHIPITISAVGGYTELKNFITTLETNLRPLSIQTINLSQTLDKDKGVPNGQFTLNLAGIIRAESLSPAYATTPGT